MYKDKLDIPKLYYIIQSLNNDGVIRTKYICQKTNRRRFYYKIIIIIKLIISIMIYDELGFENI